MVAKQILASDTKIRLFGLRHNSGSRNAVIYIYNGLGCFQEQSKVQFTLRVEASRQRIIADFFCITKIHNIVYQLLSVWGH